MYLPQVITTTQIQRNPKLLQIGEKSTPTLITSRGKTLAVLVSVSEYEKLAAKNVTNRSTGISDSLRKKLQKIDPIAYQKEIRNEY
jgi:prevent-host-death family protein